MIHDREAIFTHLRTLLAETFHLDPARIHLESNLFKDLDLDSIDAVEMAIQLQDLIGRRLKQEEFKGVRTVEDVVNVVYALTHEG